VAFFVVLEGKLELVHPRGEIEEPITVLEPGQFTGEMAIRRIEETPNITLRRRTRIVGVAGGEHLEAITWQDDASGTTATVPIRHVFSMTGARPNTGWLRGCVAMDGKRFVLTGPDLPAEALRGASWPLGRAPLLFETTAPASSPWATSAPTA
jgi:hypothetical protein